VAENKISVSLDDLDILSDGTRSSSPVRAQSTLFKPKTRIEVGNGRKVLLDDIVAKQNSRSYFYAMQDPVFAKEMARERELLAHIRTRMDDVLSKLTVSDKVADQYEFYVKVRNKLNVALKKELRLAGQQVSQMAKSKSLQPILA